MICYTEGQKIMEYLFWCLPFKRTHRKVVIFSTVNSKLSLEIIKRVELFHGIEIFVVLTMRTLHLPIMSWGKRPDELVVNTTLFERMLKQCGGI